jgi:DNA invertase Pin-like site-specific DNA recombinase
MDTTPQTELIPSFGYLRTSGESQVSKDGPVRQRAAITKFAKEHGFRIVRWFEEKAVSGTVESVDRPAFNDMLEALLSNGTKTVLIERLDRIARDVFIQEGTIRLLKEKGFELVSVAEPDLCSEDMYRVAMRQMMGVFAELDRKSIVFKLRAARQRKRLATGRCEGRKPYGTRDGEQVILGRMLNLHTLQARNFEQIARELNTAGTLSRSGKPWRPATIRRIIIGQ